jgi:hypothetical protein
MHAALGQPHLAAHLRDRLPERRISATVSALNSVVNLRLVRFSIQTDSIGASIPHFQVSVGVG